MNEQPRYYLAYGMNTEVEQMARRCPTAVRIGRVQINHYRLAFRGVADAERKLGSRMWCALWTIQPSDERALDALEGYPHGYSKRMVWCRHPVTGERVQAMIYFMQRNRHQFTPSTGYEQMLIDGYRAFGMPRRQINNAKRRAEAWLRAERKFDATEQEFA